MSSTGVYRCCDDRRREVVRAHAAMNGIVELKAAPPKSKPTLRVSFAKSPAPAGLTADDVVVAGSAGSKAVAVTGVRLDGNVLVVTLDRAGDDSSIYTLRITKPNVLDPQRAFVRFSFKDAVTAGPKARNGIDVLEVAGERTLHVFFVNAPAPAGLDARNVTVEGGERIRDVAVSHAEVKGEVLEVTVDKRGDFSPYTLTIVEKGQPGLPLGELDPRLASIDFSFRAGCESDFDCRVVESCPPAAEIGPRIDYLAKDYASFRRLMLDRLALLVPGWRERSAADLAVTLIEMLAYVGDRLSYEQDAIATEAYLATARTRISVRRHARLVDYIMHDGVNARAFVEVNVAAPLTVKKGAQFLTRIEALRHKVRIEDAVTLGEALAKAPVVFESMEEQVACYPEHNRMPFYTWASDECCLPRGATKATLDGAFPNLAAGHYLVFCEEIDPATGAEADANPAHRHAVRLTGTPVIGKDPLFDADITDIEWHGDDALPFPLCISSRTDQRHGGALLPQVSVAYGNVVLVDHGLSVSEPLGAVPEATQFRAAPNDQVQCRRAEPVAVIPRFRPTLSFGPLTQHAPFDPAASASAQLAASRNLTAVLGDISLVPSPTDRDWEVRRDLLESGPLDRHFVAEVDDGGIATLRLGDDEYGRRPVEKTSFTAQYRTGNGLAGNVGAKAIAHIVSTDSGIERVTNSIPARGGTAPETTEHAKQSAPAAFRIQQRAVTEADYAEVTQRRPDIDRAAATFRWTGSWYTVFDTIDRHGGLDVDDTFRDEIRRYLEAFRVVGRDLEVDPPRFVSIEIALTICIKPGYFRSDVELALRKVFARFFDPDNFTFGQPVALSRVVAAAAAVDGVDGVTVDTFQRQGSPQSEGITSGFLPMERLEIARLDNDRDFPEHGSIAFMMRGGA